jgi:hypothetical protein
VNSMRGKRQVTNDNSPNDKTKAPKRAMGLLWFGQRLKSWSAPCGAIGWWNLYEVGPSERKVTVVYP